MKTKINISSPKSVAILVIVLLIIVTLLPIKIPHNISVKAKLYPSQEWILVKGTDGRLMSSVVNNQYGVNQTYKVAQFERGDAVEFSLKPNIISGVNVSVEDTLGFIYSNDTERKLVELKASLTSENYLLKANLSKEKEAIVKGEEQQLQFARQQLEEQQKLFTRQKSLYEKNLISQEEYDVSESAVELFKINVDIALEKLRSVTTGAKPEEIELTKSRIEGLKQQIDVLNKRFSDFIIKSPFGGVVKRVFSSDTLLIVNDSTNLVAFLPISLGDINFIKHGQIVKIADNKTGNEITGVLETIGKSVKTAGNNQYVIATAVFKDGSKYFLEGQIVKSKIICEQLIPMDYVQNFFASLFK